MNPMEDWPRERAAVQRTHGYMESADQLVAAADEIALLRAALASQEKALRQILADYDEGAYSAHHALGHIRQTLANLTPTGSATRSLDTEEEDHSP